MNLTINAKDAMPDGGSLKITTRNVSLDEEYCRSNVGLKPGKHVCLTVSDTGTRMDEADLIPDV
jgi:signal transduction histidine kinase